MRKFSGDEIIIATHNAGKLIEFQKLLGPYIAKISSASDYHLPEPDETGATFHENAALKALAAARATGIPALADDSGLCVVALGGSPGIYSARWVENKIYQTAIDRIFLELGGKPARAEFVCVLALAWPEPAPVKAGGEIVYAEGRCGGMLIPAPRGDDGFGYDPYFVPDNYDKTFAELGSLVKDQISHRAIAFQQLIKNYF
jgi:XTP/dITP diphosphohydrolase